MDQYYKFEEKIASLLKKDEYTSTPYEENQYICWNILSESQRIIRKKGVIRIKSTESSEGSIPHNIQLFDNILKNMISKKKPVYRREILMKLFIPQKGNLPKLDYINPINEGINNGLFAELIRYKKDGMSIDTIEITIGPKGYDYLLAELHQKELDLEKWKNQWLSQLDIYRGNNFTAFAQKLLFEIASAQKQIILERNLNNTQLKKRQLYFQFLIHLIQLHGSGKGQFDRKEIGAVGYKEIGGSKMYDQEKDWLINQLQEDSNISLDKLGLISSGQIVPIYYSGILSLNNVIREPIPLGSLTDYEVQYATTITTSGRFILITENRSPLVKMSVTGWVKKQKALIISCDGQIRSAHKTLIQKLLLNPEFKSPILIWVDFDKSGLDIAKTLQTIIGEYKHVQYVLSNTMTAPERLGNLKELESQIINGLPAEQEQMLGNGENWDIVFK